MNELDEMKSAWLALNDRLKRSESLNERLIKEMLLEKSKKSVSKLTNLDFTGIIMMLLCITIFLLISTYSGLWLFIAVGLTSINMVVFAWKFILLLNVDVSKNLSHGIERIQKYSLLVKYEKLFDFIVKPIWIYLIIMPLLSHPNPSLFRIIFYAVMVIFVFILPFSKYKRIYADIQSVQETFGELKELKELKESKE